MNWQEWFDTYKDRSHERRELKKDKCEGCIYKMHSETISRMHSCNDCSRKDDCFLAPEQGEAVTLNCRFWKGK